MFMRVRVYRRIPVGVAFVVGQAARVRHAGSPALS
jgi:hypothetical protein